MRDRTMLKLGLLFMVVTIVTGVIYAFSAYNEMMGRPQTARVFQLAVPDLLAAVQTRMPEWQKQEPVVRARMLVWQKRMSVVRVQISKLQAQAVTRLKRWQADMFQQKKQL